MRRFVINICIFLLSVCISCALFICISEGLSDARVKLDKDAVFIWGDSQMFQGLDICQFSDSIGLPVYSSAKHGAGIYDFLTFVDKVPDSSKVIISFPECALYRNPKSDNNRSGLNFFAVKTLNRTGYSIFELMTIAKQNNFRTARIFSSTPSFLYEYSDTLALPEPLDGFVKMFSRTDPYILNKNKAYFAGVDRLFDKGCDVSFISFPFHKTLEELISVSVNRARSDSLAKRIISNFPLTEIDIHMHCDSLMMHDLSHMNEVGAKHFTLILSRCYLENNASFYDIQIN